MHIHPYIYIRPEERRNIASSSSSSVLRRYGYGGLSCGSSVSDALPEFFFSHFFLCLSLSFIDCVNRVEAREAHRRLQAHPYEKHRDCEEREFPSQIWLSQSLGSLHGVCETVTQ